MKFFQKSLFVCFMVGSTVLFSAELKIKVRMSEYSNLSLLEHALRYPKNNGEQVQQLVQTLGIVPTPALIKHRFPNGPSNSLNFKYILQDRQVATQLSKHFARTLCSKLVTSENTSNAFEAIFKAYLASYKLVLDHKQDDDNHIEAILMQLFPTVVDYSHLVLGGEQYPKFFIVDTKLAAQSLSDKFLKSPTEEWTLVDPFSKLSVTEGSTSTDDMELTG